MVRSLRSFLTARETCAVAIAAITGLLIGWLNDYQAKDVREWSQVVFWATVSTLAVLTYVNTRKTLLQPLRTEVFKSQLELLTKVQSEFITSGRQDLRTTFGLNECIRRNVDNLISDYCAVRFSQPQPKSIDRMSGVRPTAHQSVKIEIAKEKWLSPEVGFEVRNSFWQTYKAPRMELPVELMDGFDRLHRLLQAPLLPVEVQKSIEKFSEVLSENIILLERELNRCAELLWERYPTQESILEVTNGVTGPSWIWNEHNSVYNSGECELKQHGEKVLRSVRDYVEVERIQNS